MAALLLLIVLIHSAAAFNDTTLDIQNSSAIQSQHTKITCTNNTECGFGLCTDVSSTPHCVCYEGYTHKDGVCNYKQKDKLTAFLLSLFLGKLGADWFYLSAGHPGYIIAGLIKLVTIGGCGLWWFIDWIRILADAFDDGNGMPLGPW
jgi:TM2 domain-containing membrane protein YozV